MNEYYYLFIYEIFDLRLNFSFLNNRIIKYIFLYLILYINF